MKKQGKIRKFFSVILKDLKHVGKQLWEPLHRTTKKAWNFVTKLAKKKIFLKNVKVGGQTGDGRNKKKTGRIKKKKAGQTRIEINIYFCKSCHSHTCRHEHEKEEGLGVKTPLHNIGDSDSESLSILFGPASKGPSK